MLLIQKKAKHFLRSKNESGTYKNSCSAKAVVVEESPVVFPPATSRPSSVMN